MTVDNNKVCDKKVKKKPEKQQKQTIFQENINSESLLKIVIPILALPVRKCE